MWACCPRGCSFDKHAVHTPAASASAQVHASLLTLICAADKRVEGVCNRLPLCIDLIYCHCHRASLRLACSWLQVTTRLEDVQEQLRELVAAETLLVAHSGENDMAALKVGGWVGGGLCFVLAYRHW